ncbi:Tetratricopeptide repeat protein 14 [Geranomyces michiganensis]|nr:Tetratricopeptide repeat protein 14 [Geranomyces michiganensis]
MNSNIDPLLEPAIREFAAHPTLLALPSSAGEDAPNLETTQALDPAFNSAAAFDSFDVRNPAAYGQLMSSLAVPLRRSVRSFLVPTGTSATGQWLARRRKDRVDECVGSLETFMTLRKRQEAEFAIREVKQGIAAFQEGNNARALAKYKAALNHDPECTDAFVARGALYAKAEKYESAIADFDRALALDPTHVNAGSYRRMTCKKLAEVEREKESARNGDNAHTI